MNPILPPRVIAICGIGQMGLSMGLCCWRAGYEVLLYDHDRSKLEESSSQIDASNSWLITQFPELTPVYGSLEVVPDLQVINQRADLVLECIREDLTEKVELFRALSDAAVRGTLFCSCTSGLSVSQIGAASGFPQQLVGTHFWNPPHLMPLVEVVQGEASSPQAMQIATEFCRSLGKETVRVNVDVPGFIGNRLLHAMWREAISIVERGIASADDVDKVAKMTMGMRQAAVGPFEHMDMVGLDLIFAIQQYLLSDLASDHAPGRLLQQMVGKGELGIKSSCGFYDWNNRRSDELLQARDREIVWQLKKQRSNKNLSGTGKPLL